MQTKPDHRGLPDNPGAFARLFVLGRLEGFDKDLRICLKPIPRTTRPGNTHAYFPALAACCGLLEYMTALHQGNTHKIGWQQVVKWSGRYLPQPQYDGYVTRVLFDAFRNSVAHRGIASGVWKDENKGPNHGHRLTWNVTSSARRPAIEIIHKPGTLKKDPPWPCKYTHRVHIHLKALGKDLRGAAEAYAIEVETSSQLQTNFFKCMSQLYPR